MVHTISTSIDINASAEIVSNILFDFDNYAKWNSFVVNVEIPKPSRNITKTADFVGSQIDVFVSQGDDNLPRNFKPTILVANDKHLRWVGLLTHRWILAGEHFFEIVTTSKNSCTFKHGENFSGGLPWVLGYTTFFEKLEPGFERMNQELKALAEGISAGTIDLALQQIENIPRQPSQSPDSMRSKTLDRKGSKSSSKSSMSTKSSSSKSDGKRSISRPRKKSGSKDKKSPSSSPSNSPVGSPKEK
ncbi:hypothetical protein B0I72DRAFT_138262 [Yarrowia lipolytica]|uniref:YALI0D01716p n=3 Tax=Yarrowia lipolytica TaxID=4952 RepID=Q6CAL5_YARLI|nr:YALI0D01716p [Yarrowia lipolytica CLIB122]KAB8282533.1 hypothetical protein BKA91DRAFT_138252 [Yarrowia lipolytica]KAE8173184.1 hypothetical protein BKA90DRAFT_136038 [Yarrowia lipolytica]KAJ8054907.1 hypothetical protein LXG23DRAFT_49135 [Yarrowia lipolytica]QNP98653.1 Hypothetical protein YALI2_D01094g [Yarrowia lipolytica]RDW26282.1 hypothetical protein B0I71DRAFT_131180 [Yarrowia lipolytica]|eukprot:XP_502297.1 YALI0D01716p [Yarrowia lipolytica CLIB122]